MTDALQKIKDDEIDKMLSWIKRYDDYITRLQTYQLYKTPKEKINSSITQLNTLKERAQTAIGRSSINYHISFNNHIRDANVFNKPTEHEFADAIEAHLKKQFPSNINHDFPDLNILKYINYDLETIKQEIEYNQKDSPSQTLLSSWKETIDMINSYYNCFNDFLLYRESNQTFELKPIDISCIQKYYMEYRDSIINKYGDACTDIPQELLPDFIEGDRKIKNYLPENSQIKRKIEKEILLEELGVQTKQQAIHKLGKHATSLLKENQYDNVIKQCDKVIQLNPKNAVAWLYKGFSLSELHSYKDAFEALDKALNLNANYKGRIEKIYKHTLRKVNNNDINRILNKIPDKQWAKNYKTNLIWNKLKTGNNHYNNKDYNKAIKFFNEIIDINPVNASAWFNIGLSSKALYNYDEAIDALNKAVKLKPSLATRANKFKTKIGKKIKRSDELNRKGISFKRKGKYKEAMKYYNSAIKLNPNNLYPWYNKGFALKKIGKYQQAIDAFTEAEKLQPSDKDIIFWTYQLKGECLIELKKYHEAIKSFDNALEFNPNHKSVKKGKIKALLKIAKSTDAHNLDKLRKYHDKIYMLLGKERAIYDEDLAIDASNMGCDLNNNCIQIENKYPIDTSIYFELAAKYHDIARQLNPNNPSHWNNEGISLMNNADYSQASMVFIDAEKLFPDEPCFKTNKKICIENLSTR